VWLMVDQCVGACITFGVAELECNFKSVRRIDRHLCCGPVETLERLHEHFQTVLNVSSVFSEDTIDSILKK